MKDKLSIVSCCESTGKGPDSYDVLAVRLAYSIRKNGGSLSGAPIYMWYAEDRPPAVRYAKMLTDFGCVLVPGKVVMPSKRVYNKITAVSIPMPTEYCMWVDSDVFVLKDMHGILPTNFEVSASPTTFSHHKWANFNDKSSWDNYYTTVGLDNPNLTLHTDVDNSLGIFYLCSGIFIFKNNVGFDSLYKECATAVLRSDVLAREESFSQTALTLAVVKSGLKFKKLDERFQLVYSIRGKLFSDTVMVHYQESRVTEISNFDWSAGGIL